MDRGGQVIGRTGGLSNVACANKKLIGAFGASQSRARATAGEWLPIAQER